MKAFDMLSPSLDHSLGAASNHESWAADGAGRIAASLQQF
jgi:hypothetical protein